MTDEVVARCLNPECSSQESGGFWMLVEKQAASPGYEPICGQCEQRMIITDEDVVGILKELDA